MQASSIDEDPETFALEGAVVAIAVPFQEDTLRVDDAALAEYLMFLWGRGIKNIIVNGTTGEFPSMTLDERKHVAEVCRAHWPGTVLLGVSATAVPDALDLLDHAQQRMQTDHGEKTVADAVLILPPYYFASATDAGLESFMKPLLERSHLPAYFYNFQVHTSNRISVDSYKRLAEEFDVVRGIKNTVPDVDTALPYKNAMPNLQVYLGNDAKLLEGLQAGLDGGVAGAMSSALADVYAEVHEAYKAGNLEAAQKAQKTIQDWGDARECQHIEDVPAGKTVLSEVVRGFPTAVRPPLVPATQQQRQAILERMPEEYRVKQTVAA
jgi:4-hydroxy-tetrahydrodipicolinate synthase